MNFHTLTYVLFPVWLLYTIIQTWLEAFLVRAKPVIHSFYHGLASVHLTASFLTSLVRDWVCIQHHMAEKLLVLCSVLSVEIDDCRMRSISLAVLE